MKQCRRGGALTDNAWQRYLHHHFQERAEGRLRELQADQSPQPQLQSSRFSSTPDHEATQGDHRLFLIIASRPGFWKGRPCRGNVMILAQVINLVLDEKRNHKLRKEQSQRDIPKEEVNRPNCRDNRVLRTRNPISLVENQGGQSIFNHKTTALFLSCRSVVEWIPGEPINPLDP